MARPSPIRLDPFGASWTRLWQRKLEEIHALAHSVLRALCDDPIIVSESEFDRIGRGSPAGLFVRQRSVEPVASPEARAIDLELDRHLTLFRDAIDVQRRMAEGVTNGLDERLDALALA